jgi:HEPN domain-containing protein
MGVSWKQWVEQARYDLDTAQAMLDAGRHLYVVFCCQQAVEKMLKALIAQRSKELPPRIHQLVRLAEVASVAISEQQADLLRELSAYYFHSRYPEEIVEAGAHLTEQQVRRVLAQTQEIIQWLNSMS